MTTIFGIIVGNRGFFPDKLARQGRQDILAALKKWGFGSVVLGETDTKYGAVETFADACKCAELFNQHRSDIAGIIITLPNFGDEKSAAEVVKRAALNVPILVQAQPDTSGKLTIKDRRDSFCGKISVCNNLLQAGVPFTLTRSHTIPLDSAEFHQDVADFAAVCRIVKGLRHVRFGALGARPAAFNTVRYSEKIMESYGIGVETLDLSEVMGRVERLKDGDPAVKAKLAALKKYIITSGIADSFLLRMAKFGAVVDGWIAQQQLAGTAIQCWTSLEEFFGIAPCALMSLMSESLLPSACEVDVTGLLAMYILQLAAGAPSALLDWNNNYADDPDKCVLFHCSNLPSSFLRTAKMGYQEIIAGAVGKENAYGTVVGRIKAAPATFCRTTTDDAHGIIRAYVGQGQFTNDKLATFGGYGVMKIPNLQKLLTYICENGFEHHVAVNLSQTAAPIAEALHKYLAWDVHLHS